MSFLQQLKEAALVSENVKAELSQRKYFFGLAPYIAAISGVIFGIGSYFATMELLPPSLSANLFALAVLITAFYFVAKITQWIVGFILWVAARMFHYRVPIIQVIRSVNFAFLPLWLAAPVAPFLVVASDPLTGTSFYIASIFVAAMILWFVRSLIHVMHAVLSTTIHQARVITGVSCALIMTFILLFT